MLLLCTQDAVLNSRTTSLLLRHIEKVLNMIQTAVTFSLKAYFSKTNVTLIPKRQGCLLAYQLANNNLAS